MKWHVELDLKNVDDDMDATEICEMVAAVFDTAWTNKHGEKKTTMKIEGIEVSPILMKCQR